MKKVRLDLAVDLESLVALCNGSYGVKKATEIACPIDAGPLCGVFLCPFKGKCSEVTIADWESVAEEDI